MRRLRPILWVVILGSSAFGQVFEERDLSGYSGFVRVTREYRYESSLDLPAGDQGAFMRAQGITTDRKEISFNFVDGQATGTLTRDFLDTYSGHLHFVGRCLNGNAGTADQTEQGEAVGTTHASGAGTCTAFIDESGYSADCFTEVQYTYTLTSSSTGSLTSNCPEIENVSSTDTDTVVTEDFGFGAGFSGTLTPPMPAVLSGSVTEELDPWTRETTSWMLARQGEHELLLEPQADYDTWRPKAGEHERARGNTMVIKATLQRRGGGRPNVLAKEIIFRLSQRSHEPGVAMNHPPVAARVSPPLPDLGFEPELNEALDLVVDKNLGVARTVEGSYDVAYVHLSSFDWGAYGAITAEAVLHSGERVAGIVTPGQFELLIPKRQTLDDPIAAGWRAAGAGRTGDAASDDDALPAGDGHDGDGLSLYEEYRGFFVNRVRVPGNPAKKELFVRNELGAIGLKAAATLSQASDLRVHSELRADELDEFRAINFNSSGRFQRVRQHALVLKVVTDERTYAIAVGDLGTPGGIEAIEVPLDFVLFANAGYMASTIAHEMSHGVNVRHHGETDLWDRQFVVLNDTVYETVAGDTTTTTEGKTPVTLFNEDGSPFPNGSVKPGVAVHVGVRQGQHSGEESCLMRYDTAKFHIRDNAAVRIRNATPEVVGTSLCGSATGTGVNAASHLPVPRYGDAARGGCKHQVCVNDRHHRTGN